MIKRLLLILSSLIAYVNMYAQPAQLILSQKEGRITFAVDEVDIPDNHCGLKTTGSKISLDLNRNIDGDLFSDWEPKILANSFADVDNLYDIGEDVVFQMLLKAWCQHRPVVLTPDAIWLIICQQFSHIVNENPEKYRGVLVNQSSRMTCSRIRPIGKDSSAALPPKLISIPIMALQRRWSLISPLPERMNASHRK